MTQVDAFSDRVFAGNPAAVLVLDDWLPEPVMQAIAEENNLAETAFVRRGDGVLGLRWFTPVHEAEFCGHATLAAACTLARRHGVDGAMRFMTKVGEIRVEPVGAGFRLDLPRFDPIFDVAEDAFVQRFRPEGWRLTFRNFENFFFVLADEDAVRGYAPDMMGLSELGTTGLCVTAAGSDGGIVSRYFAPGSGIPEDPVTGSTHATLVPYWASVLGETRFAARQLSRRGGRLGCELTDDRVLLTGEAAIYMDATIHLP